MMINLTQAFSVLFAVSVLLTSPARAEKFDVSTLPCSQVVDAIDQGSKDDKFGMGAVLYWIAGYLSPEEQSTIVDFKSLETDFNKIVEQCRQQPKVAVMTTAEKYTGANATPSGKGAMDIATVTCSDVINSDEDDEDGLGLVLMWLAGYHAWSNESTVFDGESFLTASEEIGKFCAENPETSFLKASELSMLEDDE